MSNWTFTENFLWGNNFPQCLTKTQSPININTELIQKCNTLCNFKTHYKPSKCYVNYKNNLIRIKYSQGSYLEFEGVLYELKEITIHVPTLHSIDNEKFDLEICMIHDLSMDNTKVTTEQNVMGVILCRMFEVGPHYGKPERFINQIINDIPIEEINYDKEVEVSKQWGAEYLLPENKSCYIYDGSLPFPPCNTNYKIIVYEDIGFIGKTNIEILKLNLDTNIRPVQQLYDRTVFYKTDIGTSKRETKFTSNNKYLKCEKKKIIREKKKIETILETTSVMKTETGLSEDIKRQISQILFTLIILLILVTAVIMTKYIFYHKYAQKVLKVLVGPVHMVGYTEQWNDPKCNVSIDSGSKN